MGARSAREERSYSHAYVRNISIRQHTSAYVARSAREERSYSHAYVSIRQHTSSYVGARSAASATPDVKPSYCHGLKGAGLRN